MSNWLVLRRERDCEGVCVPMCGEGGGPKQGERVGYSYSAAVTVSGWGLRQDKGAPVTARLGGGGEGGNLLQGRVCYGGGARDGLGRGCTTHIHRI